MSEVKLNHVQKVYPGGFEAVKDFDLRIGDGEFVVLVGPSGCGKSTTLRMIAGLEEISGGTIEIGDRVVNSVHPKDRDIAMVFQNYALYPHMSVYKNMAFALKLRRVPKQEIDRRVREAAEILGITSLLERKPKQLSGGQRQRVAVGRAIVREPKAFLFDEPLSNLDAKLRVTTRAELKSLHMRLKTTTVYVTHDQEEAMTLGDRVVIMAGGIIQQADSPFEVYQHPVNRFVASFIGMPPMNFFEGTVEKAAGGELLFVEGSTDPDGEPQKLAVAKKHAEAVAPYVGKKLALGLRPQLFEEAAFGEANTEARAEKRAFYVNVKVVEPLGDQMDAYCATSENEHIVARISAHANLPIGSVGCFKVDMEQAHYFLEGEFGRNLVYAAKDEPSAEPVGSGA
ncbi:MAG: sn-glycerol-3-phosphate ABC transporter ATP-binding protein UgpC [Planctomycetota bacterium]